MTKFKYNCKAEDKGNKCENKVTIKIDNQSTFGICVNKSGNLKAWNAFKGNSYPIDANQFYETPLAS